MAVKLKVYVNEDDAYLYWSIRLPIKECRGFALERKITDPENRITVAFLSNRTGFENDAISNEGESVARIKLKPSSEWPFQRFSWTDHSANIGDTVSYRVIPVIRNVEGNLQLIEQDASNWSAKRILGAPLKGTFKPYFNRGFVMSQFMAHYLKERNLSLKAFKDSISDADDRTIRHFLSGDLRVILLREIRRATAGDGHIYAALFELSDQELINALSELGQRAHVVLANGSITKGKTETAAQARIRDENQDARAHLMAAGVNVEIEKNNRFLSPGALGHNKFMVRTDKDKKPLTAWTGSTNWTTTGLCTQVNNGLLIEDPEIAQVYLTQWNDLKAAASDFPKTFVANNSVPKNIGKDLPGQVRSTVWFTRTHKGVDLQALRELVMKAEKGILFLMFMPGATGLLSSIAAQSSNPSLYVRGVVSELPNGQGDESATNVNLIDGKKHTSLHLDIIEPKGVPQSLANFAEEVTRQQFLSNIGFAIIHSKVVVIDPFCDDPIVITGSHNFSGNASAKNDENFIIIKGDKELAEAYAVNIMGAYDHYRYRSFINQSKSVFTYLRDSDSWQAPMIKSREKDFSFWGV